MKQTITPHEYNKLNLEQMIKLEEWAIIKGYNPICLNIGQMIEFLGVFNLCKNVSLDGKLLGSWGVKWGNKKTHGKELCDALGVQPGETTPDGLITVEAVMCLAACDKAPMFQAQSGDGIIYYEDMDVEKTMALIDEWKKEAA